MAIFKKGKTRGLPLKTRVDAAEALDQASRSRLRVPKNGDYWVKITGGTLTTGDPEAFQSLPAGTRRVESFRIGRYPVTVWEYGKYLEANPKQEKPQEWEEQEKHPGRPVVSVSWNDAQAYCRWAGCRLLTDHEWEFAARGEKGRIYAWGDEPPDEQRANFGMKVGHPSPVGMFPEGATPEGVADMTGNVWEWTQSDFEEGRKSVRGASFIIVDAEFLRAAARDGLVPGLWDFDLGFRCAGEVFP
jgi:formylglycine-generating enzyme required for sulfatase activity